MINLFGPPMTCNSPEMNIAFRLVAKLDNPEIEALVEVVSEHLAYYFGWTWNPAVVGSEIRNILENARNNDPAS